MKTELSSMLTEDELKFIPLNFFNAEPSPFQQKTDVIIKRKRAICKSYQESMLTTNRFFKPILKI
jgi:hypothetical protein